MRVRMCVAKADLRSAIGFDFQELSLLQEVSAVWIAAFAGVHLPLTYLPLTYLPLTYLRLTYLHTYHLPTTYTLTTHTYHSHLPLTLTTYTYHLHGMRPIAPRLASSNAGS